jgi:hypothetical protein
LLPHKDLMGLINNVKNSAFSAQTMAMLEIAGTKKNILGATHSERVCCLSLKIQ